MQNNHSKTRALTGTAILTAVVIVLQLLGSFIRFGTFSISLVLIPIVVGAAMYGTWSGAWLGFVFSMVVLFQPDTQFFMGISAFGTILTVLVKGTLCGLCAGLVYLAVEQKNRYLAVVLAAIACPVVNTGIFLWGCRLFFFDTIREMAGAKGFDNAGTFLLVGFVGLNFVFEMIVNIVLSPVIVRLLNIGKKTA